VKKLISQEPGHISKLFKFLWGFGFLGGGVIVGVSGAFQLIYYQNYLGLSAHLYSLCIVAYTLLNAFNNPFLAYVSDHTKSRFGRRLPYFRLSAPFVAISFVMLYFVPIEANLMVTAFWFFISLLIFDIAYSMYCGMYLNLQTEITEYENERIDLQFSCEVSNYVGTLIGMILPGLIALNIHSQSSVIDFKIMIVIIAVIGLVLMLITTFIVKERDDLEKKIDTMQKKHIRSAITEYIEIFKIKPVRNAVFINFFANSAVNILTPLLYYIAIFVVKIDTTLFVMIVMLPMFLSLPLWKKIQRKFGAVRTAEFSLFGATMGFFISGLSQNLIMLLISFAFTGICIAGFRLTLRLLLSDCVDYDVVQTGKRREGVIFGAGTFTNAFTFMLIAIIPLVLDMTGFITASENGGVNMFDQPNSAIWGIRGLVMFAGFLVLISYILLLKYPLKGDKLKEIRNKIMLTQKN